MLITTCGHCGARFRVTPQQLNARQGQVRCGRCHGVFSGFESLERHSEDGAVAAAPPPPPAPRTDPLEALEPLPIEELTGIEPAQAQAPATPEPPPKAQPREAGRWREAVDIPPDPAREPPARAWTFGAALLALLFCAELAYAYREPLAQRYPVLRPWLESVCAAAGCSVAWSRDDTLLKLDDSELLEVPGRPNEIALGARIRNLAPVAQEYPHLELTLTDLTGQVAVRRVLRPVDYLGRLPAAAEVLAPGAEMALQLRLETPRVKATGYELLVFYP
jgi:predicted Zn finger-like uncharacterized protein